MDHPIYPCGDHALTVQIGNVVSEHIHQKVMAVLSALQQSKINGIQEVVPTYTTVCIHYDPSVIGYRALVDKLRALQVAEQGEHTTVSDRVICVPVCYGGEYGPDLAFVAEHNHLTEAQVIELHSAGEYLVYMLGFLPGFAYMGGMDERIACPRLQTPRVRIPAGSVGIAGTQTGIYPLASPGGWQLIGRTPHKMFQMNGERADFLLSAGDRVRFVPITPEEYERLEGSV